MNARAPRVQHAEPDAVGRRIRLRREELKLSQRQLAFPGCSNAYISRVEAGNRLPSIHLLSEIADRLGTTVHYLRTGEPDPLELGLADAKLTLRDLTTDERRMVDLEIEQALFKTARGVAWAIRRLRTEAAQAALDHERDAAMAGGA